MAREIEWRVVLWMLTMVLTKGWMGGKVSMTLDPTHGALLSHRNEREAARASASFPDCPVLPSLPSPKRSASATPWRFCLLRPISSLGYSAPQHPPPPGLGLQALPRPAPFSPCTPLPPPAPKVRLRNNLEVLFSDTVGFIQKLPPQLVAAFTATLEEIADAGVVLHVLDASAPNAVAQCDAVLKVWWGWGVCGHT